MERQHSATLKAWAKASVAARRERLWDVSHRIHAYPELGHEETMASSLLAEHLQDGGFDVRLGVGDLPTAFIATIGHGGLHVALCVEYDALPGLGHACGHNVIAAASLGAALALGPLVDDLELRLVVVGTPAEEVLERGGKPLLLEAGAFDGTHAAMMVHPTPFEIISPTVLAATRFDIEFEGKESHASAAPELGINAADAAVIAQVALGLLRQQLPATSRVHGIVDAAGSAANIIPGYAHCKYMVRTPVIEHLADLRDRVLNCFRAGGIATGCDLAVMGGERAYHNLDHDPRLSALYKTNLESLGRDLRMEPEAEGFVASTDMGNVSSFIPSIQPFMKLGAWPVANHQSAYTDLCITSEADSVVADAALALAWTAIDVASNRSIRDALIAESARKLPVSARARAAHEEFSANALST
jgi:amidohydrolase